MKLQDFSLGAKVKVLKHRHGISNNKVGTIVGRFLKDNEPTKFYIRASSGEFLEVDSENDLIKL